MNIGKDLQFGGIPPQGSRAKSLPQSGVATPSTDIQRALDETFTPAPPVLTALGPFTGGPGREIQQADPSSSPLEILSHQSSAQNQSSPSPGNLEEFMAQSNENYRMTQANLPLDSHPNGWSGLSSPCEPGPNWSEFLKTFPQGKNSRVLNLA